MLGKVVRDISELNRASVQEKWKFWKKNNLILLAVSLVLFCIIAFFLGFDTLGYYPDGSGGLISDAAVLLFILSFIAGLEYTEYTIKPEIRKLYLQPTRFFYIAASITLLVSSSAWICANTASFIVMPVIRICIILWCVAAVLWLIGYLFNKFRKKA